jgi:mono/diheme cytochrome c family protein
VSCYDILFDGRTLAASVHTNRKRRLFVIVICTLVLLLLIPVSAQSTKQKEDAQVRRGRYLVNSVAGCGDCHTPMLPNGTPDMKHQLQGTTLFFAPIHPIPNWAKVSPPIAGLGAFTEEQITTLLRTGALPNGVRPNPPMPPYHMTAQDAAAVAAYLKSLSPPK